MILVVFNVTVPVEALVVLTLIYLVVAEPAFKETVPVPADVDGVFAVQLNDKTPSSDTCADQLAAVPVFTPVTNVFVPPNVGIVAPVTTA